MRQYLEIYPQSTACHQRAQADDARQFRPARAPLTRHGLLLIISGTRLLASLCMFALLEGRGGGGRVGGARPHWQPDSLPQVILFEVILFRLGLLPLVCKLLVPFQRSLQRRGSISSIPRVGRCLALLLPLPPPRFLALCGCVEGLCCPMTPWQDVGVCRRAEVTSPVLRACPSDTAPSRLPPCTRPTPRTAH